MADEVKKGVEAAKAAVGKSVSPASEDSKLWGAIAYLLGILTGILVILVKKDDKYAKFHGMQSILLGIAVIVFSFAVSIVIGFLVFIPIIGWAFIAILSLLSSIVGLAYFLIGVLYMAYKAYVGEGVKLPYIGEQAEKMTSKM